MRERPIICDREVGGRAKPGIMRTSGPASPYFLHACFEACCMASDRHDGVNRHHYF